MTKAIYKTICGKSSLTLTNATIKGVKIQLKEILINVDNPVIKGGPVGDGDTERTTVSKCDGGSPDWRKDRSRKYKGLCDGFLFLKEICSGLQGSEKTLKG